MYVSFDTTAGATYVEFAEGPVARTVDINDVVMVDLSADGQPMGVEFAVPAECIREDWLAAVFDRFPALAELKDLHRYLPTPA